MNSLERDAFPTLGSMPIREIPAPDALAPLREIEQRDVKEPARRIRQRMSAVFVYAITCGVGDPAAIVKGAMAPMVKGRQPAVVDLDKARQILIDVEAAPAHPVTKLALRFLALTAVGPGTLAGTPWSEFVDVGETRDHIAPLSRLTLEILAVLRSLTGRGPMVFPNTRHVHKPMSENALDYAMNRSGYHSRHVPHG